MKYINRTLSNKIKSAVKTFPALVLTGPRQVGKTTLLKKMFSATHKFVSLENPDMRMRAKSDPAGFVKGFDRPAIIDEIQYMPELLSYIKSSIDDDRRPGRWLLTGSQQFALMHNVSQSLAGRAAVISLLPFSLSEIAGNGSSTLTTAEWLNARKIRPVKIKLPDCLLRGFYPEISLNKRVDRHLWCGSYINTYLERDIRNISHVGDLSQFEHFVTMCAVRTGQILNLSEMARDIGISVPTAKRWLSLLETGFQVLLLYPYYRNIGKRLVKSPKIYFNDPALCCYLLGLNDFETLRNSPHFGSIFETMIIVDFWKRFMHSGMKPSMYYIRTQDGLEIDLVLDIDGKLHLIEVKSGMTITPQHTSSMLRLMRELKDQIKSGAVISRAENVDSVGNNIRHYNWTELC